MAALLTGSMADVMPAAVLQEKTEDGEPENEAELSSEETIFQNNAGITEQTLSPDEAEVSVEMIPSVIEDPEFRDGYIEMPWDNNAPATDDDMTWEEAVSQIVDETTDFDVWVPNTDRYINEPESIQTRFPDYDTEDEILSYLTDTYPQTRRQNPYGSCWAHSAVALTEFYMIRHSLKDCSDSPVDKGVNYSELQLAYFCYHNSPNPLFDTGDTVTFKPGADSFMDLGGNLGFASQSMLRFNGITNEMEGSTAYDNAAAVLKNGLADEYAHDYNQAVLKNEYQVNLKENPKLAKQAIMENGIIGVSFYWDPKYLASDGKSFYNSVNRTTNHAVAIVGWDDNYAASHFKSAPSKNGAWLIRNSWSAEAYFSSDSYFWLSYEDTSLTTTAYVFEMADVSAGEVYDNNYYYDSQLHSVCTAPSNKTANVYTAQKSRETLKAVSFDITLPQTASIDYTVTIYKDLSDALNPESGTEVAAMTGTLPFAGRYTIPLPDNAVSPGLSQGEIFSVVVETEGANRIDREYDLLLDDQVDMNTHIGSGESFYYHEGRWLDLGSASSNDTRGNVCIRALTDNDSDELPSGISSLSVTGITSDSVTLAWSAAKDAASYQVLRSNEENGDYAPVATVDARKYTDSGLASATDYYYKVYPVRGGSPAPGDSSPVRSVTTKTETPEVTVTDIRGYTAVARWNQISGCDGYYIQTFAGGDGLQYKVAGNGTTECRLTSLTPGTEYVVKVIPYTGSAEPEDNPNVGTATFTTTTGNPVAVRNLKAVPYTADTVKLTWDGLEDVFYYRVEKREDNGENYISIGDYLYPSTFFYATGLENDKEYTFRVTAVYTTKIEGESWVPDIQVSSSPVSSYPKLAGTPVSSISTAFEAKTITINWSSIANANYYAIYRRASNESEYLPLDIVPSGVLTYTDSNSDIIRGKMYYYRVYGVRENLLTNEQGTTASGRGTFVDLEKVSNVSAHPAATKTVVSWDALEGADNYIIEQWRNSAWTAVATIPGKLTSYTLMGLSANTKYYYRIYAASEDGSKSAYRDTDDKLYYGYTRFDITTAKSLPEIMDFTFSTPDCTYDAQPHSAAVTTSIDEIRAAGISFSYARVTDGTPGAYSSSAPVNAGTWQVKVSTPSTSNYSAGTLTDDSWRFTIRPAAATVTVTGNSSSFEYDGAMHTVSGYTKACSSDLYNTDSVTFTGTASAMRTDPGKTNMGLTPAQFGNNDTNFDITFQVTDGFVEISKATQNKSDAGVTITGGDRAATYGDAPFMLEMTVESQEASGEKHRWISLDESVVTVDAAGEVTIKGQGSTSVIAQYESEHMLGEDSITVTVNKKPVTITGLSALGREYAAGDRAVSLVPGSVQGVINGDTVNVDVSAATGTMEDDQPGVNKPVTVTGVKLSGKDAANYVLSGQPTGVTVTITKTPGDDHETPSGPDTPSDIDEDLIRDTGGGANLKEVESAVVEPAVSQDGSETPETKIWVGGLQESYGYTGEAIKPEIRVYDGLSKLTEKTDYTLTYSNNKNAGNGTGKITIQFKGNYEATDSQDVSFTIVPADLSDPAVASAGDIALFAKSGNAAQNPVPVIIFLPTGKAVPKSDYHVTYQREDSTELQDSVTEPGKYRAVLASQGPNYTGTTYADVTVLDASAKNRSLSFAKVQIAPAAKTKLWTGSKVEQEAKDISVTDASGSIIPADRYRITYANNINPGKATMIVTASDDSEEGYVGSRSVNFTIKKGKGDSTLTVSMADRAVFSEGGAKPAVTVTDMIDGQEVKLREGRDYTVKYSKNTAATVSVENGAPAAVKESDKTAVAIIKGKGNYSFTKTEYFAVLPRDLSEFSLIVEDKAVSKSAAAYQKPRLTLTDQNGISLPSSRVQISDYFVNGERITSAPAAGTQITLTVVPSVKTKNYYGSVQGVYRMISKEQNIANTKLARSLPDVVYTGGAITLRESDFDHLLYFGKDKTDTLVAGTDFRIAGFRNNVKKGTAKVILAGITSKNADGTETVYGGLKTVTFKISQKKGDYKGALVNGEWK